jgi:hypothetical protein
MTAANRDFRATAISMWLQLITAAEITLIFALTALLPNMIQGWVFYLQPSEVAFEVAVRVIFTALIGAVLATVATAAVAPFLFFYPASRQRISDKVREVFVGVGAFVDFAIVLRALSKWAGLPRAATLVLFACYCVAFAVILYLPRQRKKVVTGLDDFMGERPTRRTAIATGIASAALVAAELTLGNTTESAAVVRAASPKPPGPNILLITFDALSAEDMSLYGYRLPTTPHIDEFAQNGSVFTNFYSASTFTTPSVATMLSGVYPSEDRVYHLPGRFSEENAAKTLPHLMRAGGYSTGASISSPYVYFFADGLADDYNVLPEMARTRGGLLDLWDATQVLHQRQPIGSRTREFMDLADAWDILPSALEAHVPQRFGRTASEFPPMLTF